jgi:hypothetical protein
MTTLAGWEKSIRALDGAQKIRVGHRIVPLDEKGQRFVDVLLQNDFFDEVLRDFVNTELVGSRGLLNTEFHKRATGNKHHPRYRPKSDDRKTKDVVGRRARMRATWKNSKSGAAYFQGGYGDPDGDGEGVREGAISTQMGSVKWVDMTDGFSDLWSKIRQTTFESDSGGVSANIGPGNEIMGLQLSSYSLLSGGKNIDRTLNSLWLATEYGTGIAENTGGNIRREGPTKDEDGSGRWWLYAYRAGQDREDGALFEGQRGFHFLHNARTRQPLEMYEKLVKKRLPEVIAQALGVRSKSLGVRSR